VIDDISVQLANAWRSSSWIEVAGSALALIYLALAIKQRRSCWYAAFLSSGLYVWVMFDARLYMDSLLNAYYAAMAVYGFWQWREGRDGGGLSVTHWRALRHVAGCAGVLILSLVTAFFLRRFTAAAWPFVDSMVTWASVFATFLASRKVYENWHWWLVIDSIELCVFYNRRLYLTMLLFGVYLVLIVVGMRAWSRDERPVSDAAQPA